MLDNGVYGGITWEWWFSRLLSWNRSVSQWTGFSYRM